MTTLAEHIIVAGAENRPLMLEKSMYDSWVSRIRLFIKGKKHGRMMLDSIDNGPLVYPSVEENSQTRPKKYSELNEAQQLQDDCNVQEMNIILHGLPPMAQEAGQILDEEQLAFLADLGISKAPVAHQKIPQNSAFQTDDLDAYDSDCDDLSLAKAVLMANLSSCDPEVLSEIPYFKSYLNDINQDVQ
nr:hypothetical protein [Tanacetum cinerariifolium]